ncbi:MAG: hypothetical protein QHC67_10360 [Sphingobium sp.]|nr:hypothetical protein [Sphingobium sp.]
MIFHNSIPADNPQLVADVIARIWGGKAESFRFPPWPGAFVAIAGDDRGTTLEVYPRNQAMAPAPAWAKEIATGPQPNAEGEDPVHYPFHVAMKTPKSQEEIFAIIEPLGWRVLRASRGDFFDVIEVWVENSLLLEVLTPEMQADYQKNVNLEMWRWTKEEA